MSGLPPGALYGSWLQELELGQADDPAQLLHGDPEQLHKNAEHLHKFSIAFEETHSGLAALDTVHWQGKAGEAFRAKYAEHPQKWADAATACGQAAVALEDFAHIVAWAQEQAKQAHDSYQAAQNSSKAAKSQWDQSVKDYKQGVDSYNKAVAAGQSPDRRPTDPGAFQDPGDSGRAAAEAQLKEARRQRDAAGVKVAAVLDHATGLAPAKPGFWQQMKDDFHDVVEDAPSELLHLAGGVVKGVTGIVDFARSLNPQDPYNLTHPAQYVDGLSTTLAGLVNAGQHPTKLIQGLIGTGWGSDPTQATGNLIPNLVLGAATDGAGAAEGVSTELASAGAKDLATSTAESAAEKAATGTGEDAAGFATDFGAPLQVPAGGGVPVLDQAAVDSAQASLDSIEQGLDKLDPDLSKVSTIPPEDPLAAAANRNVDISTIKGDPLWRTTDEPLYRWDDRTPDDIVKSEGFQPWNTDNTDLPGYVRSNKQSVFVGTTRDPAYTHGSKFRYEVDAPGGIDVNASVPDNPWSVEEEIAMPGGIKLENVKGWQTFDPATKEFGPFQPNPYYKPSSGVAGARP
ncbi:putative T7SS-secreted protein [Kitasatospora sp. NPDC006697]|uniref:putative T7SS-secreted protein n=1 Tax=Kitasatospora sp. NPDC006697 TaxID=3364020 RepID=UPI003678F5EB